MFSRAGCGAVIAAALLVGGPAAAAPRTSTPSAQTLGQLGIVATPLTRPEPISARRALTAVDSWFAGRPTPPVIVSLVMFSQAGSPSLATPQPAWLITWPDDTGPVGGGPIAEARYAPTPSWSEMNAVVSAITGKVLIEFPTG